MGQNGTCKLKVDKYEYKLTDHAEASRYANRKVIVTGVYQGKTGAIRGSENQGCIARPNCSIPAA